MMEESTSGHPEARVDEVSIPDGLPDASAAMLRGCFGVVGKQLICTYALALSLEDSILTMFGAGAAAESSSQLEDLFYSFRATSAGRRLLTYEP